MIICERPLSAHAITAPRPPLPNQARLRDCVERLAVPRHRIANAAGNRGVREQLAQAFADCGLNVTVQGRFNNVVALPPGCARKKITLIAAHYDTVPDCPGADDNGSALAVMLECARLLGTTGTGSTVGYVAFNAEEDGLLGSEDFVAHHLSALPCHVSLVHVLEMVGYRKAGWQALPIPSAKRSKRRADFIGLLAKDRSNEAIDRILGSDVAPTLKVLAAKTWGPLHWVAPDITRSDHFSFWKAGVAAVLWTDTGNFRNPNYHQLTDTPNTLDYRFMSAVTALLCDAVAVHSAP